MRVLVCGGRDYKDLKVIWGTLDVLLGELRQIDLLITGGANGADDIADKWAEKRGIPRVVFPANWEGERKSAGARRNARMLEIGKPHLVLAFPGGRGTENMIAVAELAKVPVRRA